MGFNITENEAIIHAGVTGLNLPGVPTWSSYSGGDVEASTSTENVAGVQPAIPLPGPSKAARVVVKRPYTTDLDPYYDTIKAAVGKYIGWASWTPTDADGNVNGETHTQSGYLNKVATPVSDSTSGKLRYLELTFEVGI